MALATLIAARPDLEPHQLILVKKLLTNDSLSDPSFIKRVSTIMDSDIDVRKALSDRDAQRDSLEWQAISYYLNNPDSSILVPRHPDTRSLAGEPGTRLVDAITTLRSSVKDSPGIDTLSRSKRTNNERAARDLKQAIGIYSAEKAHIFVRELLRLAKVGAPKTISGPRDISITTGKHNGQLLVGLRQPSGIRENQLMAMLNPGNPEASSLLGTLSGANWLRIKTVDPDTKHLIETEIHVVRDDDGKIQDIRFSSRKSANAAGFQGTLIETARHNGAPELSAAFFDVTTRDMSRYLPTDQFNVSLNGKRINENARIPRVSTPVRGVGKVEILDGFDKKVLRGRLPLFDIPESWWDGVPKGIRDFYQKEGFAINLSEEDAAVTPTHDRLRDPAQAEALRAAMPGLLVRAFLARVSDPTHADDLHRLPEVYFNEHYGLTNPRNLGAQVIQDAQAINEKRFGDVDYSHYSDERELIRLVTAVQAFNNLSLIEVYQQYQAETLPTEIRQKLPASIQLRMDHEDAVRIATASQVARLVNNTAPTLVPNQAVDQVYTQDQVTDVPTQNYLKLLKKITKTIYGHYQPAGQVVVGVHTKPDWTDAYAYHYTRGQDYHLYRTLDNAASRARQLYDVQTSGNTSMARKAFLGVIERELEVISHELTHIVTERPNTPQFTHDMKFYQDQRQILLGAVDRLTPDVLEEWFQDWRQAV